MKTWLLPLIAATIGVALGVGITVAEFLPAKEVFVLGNQALPPSLPIEERPQAVVEGSMVHDFGVMERNVKGEHTFVLRNAGTGLLTLTVGKPTCKCTIASSPKEHLVAGESTEIKMEWEAPGYQPDFHQSVEISTNDRENPMIRLVIKGNIIQAVRPVPEELTMPAVPATEGAEGVVKVFGFSNEPLEITESSLVNVEHPNSFELSVTPLSPEELSAQPEAKSGYSVRLVVKSGLPIGPLNQTIRLRTNIPTAEQIEIPVHLTITSDISIINATPGVTYLADKSVLRLGKMMSQRGKKAQLFVLVKGPYRQDTKLTVASVDPEGTMTATLGEPTELRDGVVLKYPLEISITPGSDPINRLGGEQGKLGEIILHTTHPIAKEVRLLVQFAVE